MSGVRIGWLCAGLLVVLPSGCGGSSGFDPAAQPAKTRFAIAQAVEGQVAAESGSHQGSNELTTICGTQSAGAWLCTSQYPDVSGNITSADQIVAETQITYKSGEFLMKPAGGISVGSGLSGKISVKSIAKLIRADGDNTGAGTQSGPIQLTPAELGKQSQSTLATLRAAAQAAGLNVPTTAAPSGNTGEASSGAGTSTVASPPTTSSAAPSSSPAVSCGPYTVSGGQPSHYTDITVSGTSCSTGRDLARAEALTQTGVPSPTVPPDAQGYICVPNSVQALGPAQLEAECHNNSSRVWLYANPGSY